MTREEEERIDPLSILAFATLDKRYIVTGLYTHNSEQLHFLSRYRGILLLDCSLFVVDGFVFLRNSNGLPLVVNPDLVFMTLQIVNLIDPECWWQLLPWQSGGGWVSFCTVYHAAWGCGGSQQRDRICRQEHPGSLWCRKEYQGKTQSRLHRYSSTPVYTLKDLYKKMSQEFNAFVLFSIWQHNLILCAE